MIKIYSRRETASLKKVTEWLDSFGLPYEVEIFARLSREGFFNILSLTETGVEELLAPRMGHEIYQRIEQLQVEEIWHLFQKRPELFKTPLVVEENKLLAGFHLERIRQFLPPYYRELQRQVE